MFTVISTFVDPWDGCRLYEAGGSWPRPGYDPPPDAIPALLGAGGGLPLILALPEAHPAPDPEKPKAKRKK